MKTRTFMLALLCLLPATLTAQGYRSYVSLIPPPLSGYNNHIVRSDDRNVIAEARIDANGTMFSETDVSPFYSTVVPNNIYMSASIASYLPDIHVLDMCIYGHFVVFCGYQTISGRPEAIVGYYDIKMMRPAGVSLPYTIYPFPNIYALRKVVAYKSNNFIKVVAIGFDDIDPNPPLLHDNSVIVEIDNIMNAATTSKAYIIDRSVPPYEYLDDIVYTGDKVVITGRVDYALTTTRPSIRVFDTPSSLSSSSNFNYVFDFCGSPGMNSLNRVVAIDKDRICMVNTISSISSHTRQIRLIELLGPTPTNQISQEITLDTKEDLVDLTYLESRKELVLLQPSPIGAGVANEFFIVQPFLSSPYNTTVAYFTNNDQYQSIDALSGEHFISTCNKTMYIQWLPAINGLSCPSTVTAPVSIIPNGYTVKIPNNPLPLNISTSPNTSLMYTNPDQWNPHCGD